MVLPVQKEEEATRAMGWKAGVGQRLASGANATEMLPEWPALSAPPRSRYTSRPSMISVEAGSGERSTIAPPLVCVVAKMSVSSMVP